MTADEAGKSFEGRVSVLEKQVAELWSLAPALQHQVAELRSLVPEVTALRQDLDTHKAGGAEVGQRAARAVTSAERLIELVKEKFRLSSAAEADEAPRPQIVVASSAGRQEAVMTIWKIWAIGIAATAVLIFGVPTKALPPALVPFFDPIVFLSIGVFGVMGVLAGVRDWHRWLDRHSDLYGKTRP